MGKFYQHNIPRSAKVTPEAVQQIRALYEQGMTQRELGERFDLSAGQIGRIVRGESWAQFRRPLTKNELESAEKTFEATDEPVFLPPDFLNKSAAMPDSNDPNQPDSGLDAVDEFLRKRSSGESK